MASTTSKSQTPVFAPPRQTGDPQADTKAIIDWLWAFYEATVLASGLLDPSYQASSTPVDPANLPDPTNTTIAQAQATANAAITALQNHSLYP